MLERLLEKALERPRAEAPSRPGLGFAAAGATMGARVEEGPTEDGEEEEQDGEVLQIRRELGVLFSDEPPEHTTWMEGSTPDRMWFQPNHEEENPGA